MTIQMNELEYDRICALAAYPHGDEPPLSVSEEVFLVVKRQTEHRRLRVTLRSHRQEKTLKRYIARHTGTISTATAAPANGPSSRSEKQRKSPESFYAIARSVGFSPCMLARVLLEAKYGWSKTTISNLFKDVMSGARRWPVRLPSHEFRDGQSSERKEMSESEYDRLWHEVDECILRDVYCSPLADRIRHNMGLEYEYILTMKLHSRGLLFESEDALREKGLSKTPDVRLLLPIGVRDTSGDLHIVNWIDSKAMFGDRDTHESENAGQLQGYVNRYGPGMVIYWFGHVANLSSEQEVYITDSFPSDIVLPGDMDPFIGQPPTPKQGDILVATALAMDTTFNDDLEPTTHVVG